MINFKFNLYSEQAIVRMLPINTFTEIDALSKVFGIQRYEGESYKDFYEYLNRVGINGRDTNNIQKIQEAARSEIFSVKFFSKSTDKKYKLEITGNNDFVISEASYASGSWSSTSTTMDISNRKLYPFLHDLFEEVTYLFPDLEIEKEGINKSGDFSVAGNNLVPFVNYERRSFFPTDTDSLIASDQEIFPGTIKYDSTRFVLNTSTALSTNGFYVDYHLNRLYCSTALVNNLNVRFDFLNRESVVEGYRGARIYSIYSDDSFIKLINNETLKPRSYLTFVGSTSTSSDTSITGLNETPFYLKLFEEDISVGYRSS